MKPKAQTKKCDYCGHVKRYRVEEMSTHLAACTKWLNEEYERTGNKKIGVIQSTNPRCPRWIETKRLIHKLKYWGFLETRKAKDGYVVIQDVKYLHQWVNSGWAVHKYLYVHEDEYRSEADTDLVSFRSLKNQCSTKEDWFYYLTERTALAG